MAGIFISYRRNDSQGFAGRLADDLTEILGPELVFRDVEIPVGRDFTEVLNRSVANCDVVLVVIGRNWLTPSSIGNKSRLFDPADWVFTEIEAAFNQDKQVIPVLVGGGKMIGEGDLPESIKRLSKIQAFVMSDRHWDADVQSMVKLLRKEVPVLRSTTSATQQVRRKSPLQLLLEIGELFLDKAKRQKNDRGGYGAYRTGQRSSFVTGFVRSISNIMVFVIILSVIYVGLRLFGDAEVLQMLDRFEARLQVGWNRLLAYVKNQI